MPDYNIDLPLISHLYLKYKNAVNNDNNLLNDGTMWFCEEDNSFGLKMEDSIKSFGNHIALKNLVDNKTGVINEVIIVNNYNNIDLTQENKNIIYLVKSTKQLVLVMNKTIVFEMTGN